MRRVRAMVGEMRSNSDSTPVWVKWLLIVGCAAAIGLIVVMVVVVLWPWVKAFR
jgi:hypothetical protein